MDGVIHHNSLSIIVDIDSSGGGVGVDNGHILVSFRDINIDALSNRLCVLLVLLRLSQLHLNLSLNNRFFVGVGEIDNKHLESSDSSMSPVESLVQLLLDVSTNLVSLLPIVRSSVSSSLLEDDLLGLSDICLLISYVGQLVQLRDLFSDQLVLETSMKLQGKTLTGSGLNSRSVGISRI